MTRLTSITLIAFILLTLVIVWVGPTVAPRYSVDLSVKEPDTQLELAGFYIPEANADFPYRWSQPYAFVQLPHAQNLAQHYIAAFHMRVPDTQSVRPVTVLVNERPYSQLMPTPGFRHYQIVLPAQPDSTSLRVALATTELRLPGDVRPLGLVFTAAELRPIVTGQPELAVLAALGVALVLGLLKRQTSSIGAALSAAAILGFGLAGMRMLARPTALSLPVLFGFAILAACAAILSAQRRATQLALMALMQLLVLSPVVWPAWLTDDAFISFRYAQNMAQGHGLIYNLGERVEGYTNFLWTVLAALVLWLGGDISWWAYAAGMLLGLLIVLLSFKLAAQLLGDAWGLVAALIVATNQGLLIYTTRGAGLETGLFTFLGLAGVYALLSGLSGCRALELSGAGAVGRWSGGVGSKGAQNAKRSSSFRTAGLLLALATLTRPEAALIFGVCLGFIIINSLYPRLVNPNPQTPTPQSKIPHPLNSKLKTQNSKLIIQHSTFNIQHLTIPIFIASYLAIVLPYFLWRLSYYGDLLPNTFYAKTGGGTLAMLRGLEYAARFGLAMGGPLLLLALVPILGKTKSAILSRMLGWPGMMLAVCVLYTTYIVRVGGDHFPAQRFFVPLLPWLAVLIAAGLARSYDWTAAHFQGLGRVLAALLLAVLLPSYSMYALWRAPELNQIVRGSDENLRIWQELGWWLADNAAPDDTIALMSAGAIAFYSEHTAIDMLGLTDKHIGRMENPNFGSGPAGHEKRDPTYVLYERQPTYIPRWWEDYFGGPQVLRELYEPISVTTRYGRTIELWRRR